MKQAFKTFLIETEFNGMPSFYNLYFTEYPSAKTKNMKDGADKDKQINIEQERYKKLLTDFLQRVGSMNK